jgi:hypothetical protein
MSRKSWLPDMRCATSALPKSAAQSVKYLVVENKLKKIYKSILISKEGIAHLPPCNFIQGTANKRRDAADFPCCLCCFSFVG